MSKTHQKPETTLPGYELIDLIGAGGYGEVWSAIAPGGLRKAVKYVFGADYDKRATAELHALEKIKSVRHPFLLSLERIEVLDGRLLVVTELADGSLRDRFRQCIEQGMPGIPREELLGYLSDAADALDFISSQHDLAHLDIKPENLLLVAGHVKVADFGLVKSLNNQSQASLVGGMTPAYAAPEVFRGSPSRRSDQYSLAILYQELLSGTLPFQGANAAELTLQHMKDDPYLGPLAETDRFAVARALSKDPSHRFESSRAFVQALRDAARSVGAPLGATSFSDAEAPRFVSPARCTDDRATRHSVTELFADSSLENFSSVGDLDTVRPEPLAEPEPLEVPAPPANASPFRATPAVFIGIGGVGARVLKSLRSQMHEHLGANAPIPSAPMMLLDTDPQSLATASRGAERGLGLDVSETVNLPLRRPQSYRDKSELLLRWLGRRWLYNVPRSLRTEGIRPLGRLALIDHARQAFQRLRATIVSAAEEGSREASAEAVGLPFDAPGVRVYVVASTSGGAGSGMSLDIAYAARSIVSRLGIENATFIGVLTHSTFREATRGELARVNSYAWISEFEHFRKSPQGYPGDTGVGLPAHEPGVAAFDHTYFVPLGDQLETPAFESATDAVAEYLFADAFTPGQRVLDACRQDSVDSSASTLRSFAVRHRDGQDDSSLEPLEQAAVARMVRRWLGGDNPLQEAADPGLHSTDQVVHGAVAFLGRTQLDSATLASNCRSLIEASLGGDASAYFSARFGAERSRVAGEAASRIDRCFGVLTPDATPQHVDGKPIETVVAPIVERLADDCALWALGKINDTQERVDGALRSVAWLRDYLAATDGELQKVTLNVHAERNRVVSRPLASSDAEATEVCFKLFRLRLDQIALVAGRKIVETLQKRLAELELEIAGLRAVLDSVAVKLASGEDGSATDGGGVERFSIAVEQRLQADYLTAHGGLLGALTSESASDSLVATIAHAAKMVSRESGPTTRVAADAALAAGFAEPPVNQCGGVFRRLTLEQSPTATAGPSESGPNELLLVTEMAGVSLPHLAALLIGGRRDYAAFAERVRTRRDVPWIDPVIGGCREPITTVSPSLSSLSGPMPTTVLR